jgi:hypothetical protein
MVALAGKPDVIPHRLLADETVFNAAARPMTAAQEKLTCKGPLQKRPFLTNAAKPVLLA